MYQLFYRYFITVMAICTISACGSSDKPAAPAAPPPVPVVVYTIQKGSSTFFDEYPATVIALNEVQIRPQVSGYITGIFFKDGQQVKQGQKLYAIDQQQYQANYNQAVANLNVTKANLAKAQHDADRYEELEKNDAIARQTVEHAQADLEAAKMELEAAKANVANVQTSVRYATIFAPFDGTIGISQVKMGTAVSPGQTILNTVSSDDPMAVDVAVDQKEIARFALLQQNKSSVADSLLTLEFPGDIAYPYPGQISMIDRAVDPQTGTIKTRLVFPNAKRMLKSGMNCNVRIKSNGNAQSILVPTKSILEQMGEYFVYVVGDSSKVHLRKIQPGRTINANTIVRSGVEENEKIVTEGVQKLRDGAAVQVARPDSTRPAGAH